MTADTCTQPAEENRSATSLKKAGIAKALIIDDAYDPPIRETCKNEISEFWGTIERDKINER